MFFSKSKRCLDVGNEKTVIGGLTTLNYKLKSKELISKFRDNAKHTKFQNFRIWKKEKGRE